MHCCGNNNPDINKANHESKEEKIQRKKANKIMIWIILGIVALTFIVQYFAKL